MKQISFPKQHDFWSVFRDQFNFKGDVYPDWFVSFTDPLYWNRNMMRIRRNIPIEIERSLLNEFKTRR